MAEVTQLNLVRESNAHLRRENEELSKRLSVTGVELKSSKDSVAPLEESVRKVRADKEGLEAVNAQLLIDINYWRDRLHSLVSRYHDVDPEEHRLLQGRFEEAEKAVAQAKTVLKANENEINLEKEKMKVMVGILAAKEEEIVAQKATYCSLDNNNNQMRSRMRSLKDKFDDFVKDKKEEDRVRDESARESATELKLLEQRLLDAEKAAITANIAAG